jgi:hypothetical protein
MARVWKKFRKYEKAMLLGLVVILLVMFNVTGVVTCAKRADQGDFSGSFEVAPGNRVEVSHEEFVTTYNRYRRFLRAFGASFRYGIELGRADDLGDEQATWAHLAAVRSAQAAGYRVGEEELSEEIKKFVAGVGNVQRGRGSSMGFSEELYARVLEYFGGTKGDFEATFREVLLKDKLLGPLIDAERVSLSREEGFQAWKASRERVNLRYVAVPAAQFADAVRLEEDTRSSISTQQTVFDAVVGTATRVKSSERVLAERFKDAPPPADAAALKALKDLPLLEDGWKRELEYRVEGGKPVLFSAGPDGTAGTPDDVGRDHVKRLETLASLRLVADGLLAWRKAAGEWPKTLDVLTTPPPAPTGAARALPPLREVPKDAWDHALVYEPEGLLLLASGPDGARGTEDDLTASVAPERVVVAVPKAFEPYVKSDLRDAWGKPLAVQFQSANPWKFATTSAGPDGVAGNDDDVTQGNAAELAIFYNRVRSEFVLTPRQEFEAVWVHLPLVPDEVFRALWAKHPEFRPKEDASSDEGYDRWRKHHGSTPTSYYRVEETDASGKRVPIDPADPEKGPGAELVPKEAREKGFQGWLVPAPETLGEQKEPPPPPAPPAGTIPQEDPLRKTYLEKGWRRVLLREMFFEHLLATFLKEVTEAQAKVDKWEADGKRDPEPKRVEFSELLARYSEFAPGAADREAGARFLEYYVTDAPKTRTEWEALPGVGDPQISLWLPSLRKEGAVKELPVVTRRSAGRVLLRGRKFHPERTPELDEVRDKVMPKYLASRAMDKAEQVLGKVRDAVKDPEKDRIDAIAKDLAQKGSPWTFETGETGPFVGRAYHTAPPVPAGLPDAEKPAYRRRSYVRRFGYGTVESSAGTAMEAIPVKPGQVGRRASRDDAGGEDSTASAYLVQVISRADPGPEEFSGEAYARWLHTKAYGATSPDLDTQLAGRKGYMYAAIAKYFTDYDSIRQRFSIQTARHPSEQQYPGRKPSRRR